MKNVRKQIKSGKEKVNYHVYKDEGNPYCPLNQWRLKAEILRQGFTFKETEGTIEIQDTGSFLVQTEKQQYVQCRNTKLNYWGDKVLVVQLSTKANMVDKFFIKQGNGMKWSID